MIIGERVVIGGYVQTDVFDLTSGKLVQSLPVRGVANAGHLQAAEGRVFAQPDGKHGNVMLMHFDLSGPEATHLPASVSHYREELSGAWLGPHTQSTSYGSYLRHPIVDGRIIIRGGDNIYCYDLRAQAK